MKLPTRTHRRHFNLILSDCAHPMDVPILTCSTGSSHFAISCGIGFDAGVCHEVSVTPLKKILNRIGLGKLVYLFVALKQLLFLTPSPMTLVWMITMYSSFQSIFHRSHESEVRRRAVLSSARMLSLTTSFWT